MTQFLFSEYSQSLKKCRDDLTSFRVRHQELNAEFRMTKAELESTRSGDSSTDIIKKNNQLFRITFIAVCDLWFATKNNF